MQQPAPRSKAAMKRGVQAEGLRTWSTLAVLVDLLLLLCCEGGALYLRSAEILLAVEVHHEHIRGLHELFLHATGRNIDLVFMANTRSSSRTCDLSLTPSQHSTFQPVLPSSPRPQMRFQHTHPKV